MLMQDIVNMISNVGFPIAMCLIIMYYWNNQYSIDELKSTISRLTEVVAENTKAITLLQEKIGDDKSDNEN